MNRFKSPQDVQNGCSLVVIVALLFATVPIELFIRTVHRLQTGHQPIFVTDDESGEGFWACANCSKSLSF